MTSRATANAQVMREVYFPGGNLQNGRAIERSTPTNGTNGRNRLNTSPGMAGKCLAGQAAGWTHADVASKQCCPGYGFSALSASEAYVNYGIPIGDIVAGIASIGICLKSMKIG